jgi:uridine kinase
MQTQPNFKNKSLVLENLKKVLIKYSSEEKNAIKHLKPDFVQKIAQLLITKNIAIAISGESASGKSTFVSSVQDYISFLQEFNENNILTIISADNYFNDISEGIKKYGSFNALIDSGYNPDSPESFQLDLMREDIKQIKDGQDIFIPKYEVNGTGINIPKAIFKKSANITIIEGICVLYDRVHDLFDIKIYIDIDEKTRKERYISRAKQRNQSVEEVKQQWEIINESATKYIRPTRKHADIVLNGGVDIKILKEFASDLLSIVAASQHQFDAEDYRQKLVALEK